MTNTTTTPWVPRSHERVVLREERTFWVSRDNGCHEGEAAIYARAAGAMTVPAGTVIRVIWCVFPPRDHGPASDQIQNRRIALVFECPERRPYNCWMDDPEPGMTPERFNEVYRPYESGECSPAPSGCTGRGTAELCSASQRVRVREPRCPRCNARV